MELGEVEAGELPGAAFVGVVVALVANVKFHGSATTPAAKSTSLSVDDRTAADTLNSIKYGPGYYLV